MGWPVNAEPHVHDVKVKKRFSFWFDRPAGWEVVYGDQQRIITRRWWVRVDSPWFHRRVADATRRAVVDHDRESIAAGKRRDALRAVQAAAEAASKSDWVGA